MFIDLFIDYLLQVTITFKKIILNVIKGIYIGIFSVEKFMSRPSANLNNSCLQCASCVDGNHRGVKFV